MHPHIFYRVQKKLKPESKLPPLNLHEFYPYDHQSDIQLSITPCANFMVSPKVVDYVNENNDNMLKKLDTFDEMFDNKYNRELFTVID